VGVNSNVRYEGRNGLSRTAAPVLNLTPSRHKREDLAATHKLMGERPG
jgi:hypothetical protein